ncbi:MAG: hypothetical protein DDG59_03285 [Anaerolineae bacterium]|jgi:predicted Zn-dependent protease|nr:MAG: hypothetical protein DDG59_03285 [Anaerolineae bacterium]
MRKPWAKADEGILPNLAAILALLIGIALLFPFERGSAALRQARLAEQQGDFKSAAQLYRQASRVLFWDKVDLQIKAAQNAAQVGDSALVIAILAPLQEERQLTYQAQVLLAQAYLASNDPDAAMSIRQGWVEKGYSTEAIDPLLLKLYYEQGRIEQTLPILQALAAAQPETAEWHYRLGLVLAAESPEEALPALQNAAQLDASYQGQVSVLLEQLAQPSSEKALEYLYGGRGLAMLGEWQLAERAFQHAVEQRPDFPEAWAYLGLARFRLSAPFKSTPLKRQNLSEQEDRRMNTAQAEQPGLAEIQYALQLNPRSQLALAFLTLIWQELGEAQLALQSAQQAFQLYPHDLNVRLQYAQALAQTGDLEGGWQILYEWISQSSVSQTARKALVLYCVQYGYRLQESALPLVIELTYQTPQDAESWDLLGQVYLGLENWSAAQEALERALSLDAGYAPAILHLGIAYLSQGKTALARAQFQKAVEIAPHTPSGEQAKRYLEIYLP